MGFPNSPFSKANVVAGQTSDPADVNDVYAELAAIGGITNGTAPLNSSNITAAGLSAGASTVTGLSVTGTSTFVGSVTLSSNATLTGSLTLSSLASAANQPRCVAFNSVLQAISSASTAVLTLDSEVFDVGAMHSTSANPSRITVPAGSSGIYWVHGVTSAVSSVATTPMRLYLRKTGTDQVAAQRLSASTVNAEVLTVSALLVLDGGDYVELAGASGSDGVSFGAAVGNGTAWATRLSVQKLW